MKQLCDQVSIGSVTARNRICIPPMVCFHWADDTGRMTSKHIAHYEALAKGGAGLIIVEATCVTKRGRLHESQLGLWEDGQISGFQELTQAVHQHGCPVFVQLHHAGVNGIDPFAYCPSDYVSKRPGHHTAQAMTLDRIAQIREAFIAAAKRAQEAGFDGVELHGCHGYLLCQFLNKHVNQRTDAYGQKKTLLAEEILKGIKDRCGAHFCVGIRISAFEPTLEDGIYHAKALAPFADFLDIAYGFGGESTPEKPDSFPFSPAFYGATKIKQVLPDMAVFGVDGLAGGEMPLQVLTTTGLDMLCAGRASLVDPAFAAHVLKGQPSGMCLRCRPACHWSPFLGGGDARCPGHVLFLRDLKKGINL